MNAPDRLLDMPVDRRRFLGGSDAAAVMGLSKWRTPYQVYLAKTADVPEEMDPERRKFLERRKRWEPVVVQMLREEFDAEIVSVNQRYVDPEVPYFAAEIDFEWRDADGSIQNGEIKTVSQFSFGERYGWGEAGTDEIPIDYEAQVQHGLGVKRRKICAVAAMVGLDSMVFYRVERNGEVISEMRARLARFWNENVLAKIAPDPQTIEDLHRMFRKTNGMAVQADTELGSKALRLRALVAQIDAFELEREALEFDVKNAMREHDSILVDGRKIATWGEQNWSRLDQAAIKENEKEIYRKYLKTGKYRVFKTLRST